MKHAAAGLALVASLALLTAAAASAARPDDICHDPALSNQEQTLCIEQIAKAQSVPEQKAIQTKYRDRVASRKKK